MEINEYLASMGKIQSVILDYVDEENDGTEKFKNLVNLLKIQKILDDKHKLTPIIELLSFIVDYHFRTINFFDKIFNILLFLKEPLLKYYSDHKISNFFKNKKVILFLIKEKIVSVNEIIAKKHLYKFGQLSDTGIYLFPEIKESIDERCTKYAEIPENIEKIREIEYSDNNILQIIQKDQLDEFILYINKNEFEINDEIQQSSTFETNLLLSQDPLFKNEILSIGKRPIEYAAFYGSIKIFKYLISQKCQLTQNLWFSAIHGRNPEIIHILEENQIELDDSMMKECLSLAIKCHHNELVSYIIDNYIVDDDVSSFVFEKSLKSHNFSLIQPEKINSDTFYELCKRNYYILAKLVMENDKNIDINSLTSENKKYETKVKNTALFISILKDNIEIVQLLLENENIDVNKKSLTDSKNYHCEITPLFIAAKKNEIEIIRLLLNHKDININALSTTETEQITPLNAAISNENIEIVQLFVNREDIDINLQSLQFMRFSDQTTCEHYIKSTPLYHAANRSNSKIVQILLNHKNIDINAVINITIERYDTRLDKKIEPIYTEETALIAAIKLKNIEIVQLLLSRDNIDVNFKVKLTRLNISKKEIPTLQEALFCRNIEIVKLLLRNKNIDVNAKQLIIAKKQNVPDIWDEKSINSLKIEFQKEFVNEDCNNYSTGQFSSEKSILHTAIEFNMIEVVRLLLQTENIDVNSRSFLKSYQYYLGVPGFEIEEKKLEEKTPLYLAVDNEQYEIIQMLVEHKDINVNMKSTIYKWKNKQVTDIKKHTEEEDYEEENVNDAENNNENDFIEEEEEDKNESSKEEEDTNESPKEEENNETDFIEEEEEDTNESPKEEEDNNNESSKEKEEEDYKEEEEKYEQGEKVVDKEETALHRAVAKGKLKIIKLLLGQKSIDINVTNKQGKKPMELNRKEKVVSLFNQP